MNRQAQKNDVRRQGEAEKRDGTDRSAALIRDLLRSSAILLLLLGAASATTFTVNTTDDDVDANPADGICEITAGGGDCSLRAAIQQANATSGRDEIDLPAGTYSLILEGTGENAAATGDLDITESVAIHGAGADVTVINGGRFDRVFEIDPAGSGGVEVEIGDVTIEAGSLRDVGGAILNNGTLSLTNVAVRTSTANNGDGGGIFNGNVVSPIAMLTLTNVLVASNQATGNGSSGGGVLNNGDLMMVNSTVSHNMADASGGGIDNRGSLSVSSSTIANNTAPAGMGGGVLNRAPISHIMFEGTIIAGNTGGNCRSALVTAGHNLEDTNTCGFTETTDIVGVDPQLCALGPYGGPTFTHAVPMGSAALDAGGSDCPATDQRGEPRPKDGNGDGTSTCDIGAFEAQTAAQKCETVIPTQTPTRPAATPTPTLGPACPGDCGEDGDVTVDELLRAIGIALSDAPVSTSGCRAADLNHDDKVTIDELVTAVRAALEGCS